MNFNSLKPKPPDVTFADDDADNNGNVNDLLEKAIRDRENLSIPGPISRPETADTSNISEVGNVEVKLPENTKAAETVNVDANLLSKILEKLNTIEELIRKNDNIVK